jgi:hypothetical protein
LMTPGVHQAHVPPIGRAKHAWLHNLLNTQYRNTVHPSILKAGMPAHVKPCTHVHLYPCAGPCQPPLRRRSTAPYTATVTQPICTTPRYMPNLNSRSTSCLLLLHATMPVGAVQSTGTALAALAAATMSPQAVHRQHTSSRTHRGVPRQMAILPHTHTHTNTNTRRYMPVLLIACSCEPCAGTACGVVGVQSGDSCRAMQQAQAAAPPSPAAQAARPNCLP